jgi:hypothetical protein
VAQSEERVMPVVLPVGDRVPLIFRAMTKRRRLRSAALLVGLTSSERPALYPQLLLRSLTKPWRCELVL